MRAKTQTPTPESDEDQRSGCDRRRFSYTCYIPERRDGKDRREEDRLNTAPETVAEPPERR